MRTSKEAALSKEMDTLTPEQIVLGNIMRELKAVRKELKEIKDAVLDTADDVEEIRDGLLGLDGDEGE